MKLFRSLVSLVVVSVWGLFAIPLIWTGISIVWNALKTNTELTASEELTMLVVIFSVTIVTLVVYLVCRWIDPLDERQKEALRRFRRENLTRMR